jgi:hypothetical protein
MRSLQSVTPSSSEAGYPRWGRLVGYARPATMQFRTQLVGESHVAVACQTRIGAGLESEPLRSCRTRGVKPSRYVMSEVEAQVDTFTRYLDHEQTKSLKPGQIQTRPRNREFPMQRRGNNVAVSARHTRIQPLLRRSITATPHRLLLFTLYTYKHPDSQPSRHPKTAFHCRHPTTLAFPARG